MAKIDELHNYAYPDKYLDELHIYDKSIGNSGGFDEVHNYGNRGVTYGMDELHLYGSYQTVETSEDEINTPSEAEVIDIDKYFDEIEDLDEDQKEIRKEVAKDFKDILKLVLALMLADLRVGNEVDSTFYHVMAKNRFMDVIDTKLPYISIDIYIEIEKYIDQNLNLVIESTIRNSETPYFFSEARATSIAVDDSMASINLEELGEAVEAGYTHKKWVTMRDKKVRHSHEKVDDEVVEIDKPFKVGRCLMQAPMIFDENSDYQDPKETINCRCCLVYVTKSNENT